MSLKDLVEKIKSLSTDEKHKLQFLLKQYLREEISENFKSAQVEQQTDKLKFSANIQELKQLIEE